MNNSIERRTGKRRRPFVRAGAVMAAVASLVSCSGSESSKTAPTAPDARKVGAVCTDLVFTMLDDAKNIALLTPAYQTYGGAVYHSTAYTFDGDNHTVFVPADVDPSGSTTHDFPDEATETDVRAVINFTAADGRSFGSTIDCERTFQL